jgi:hypothetical protein
MYCEITQIDANTFQCKACGRKYRATCEPEKFLARCSTKDPVQITPSQGCCGEPLTVKTCQPAQVAGTRHEVFRCIYCGKFPVESSQPCSGGDQPLGTNQMQTAAARLTGFAFSLAKHLHNNSPTCTGEEIAERFMHCSTCEDYNPTVGACSKCGCYVNLNAADEGWNALAWADKECPHTPPKFLTITRPKS